MIKVLHKAALIVFNIVVVIFGLSLIFTGLLKNSDISSVFDSIFGAGTTVTVNTGKAPVYYKSWYQSIEDLTLGNAEFANAAEAEGTVLLKNETDKTGRKALPLDKAKDKISLFGVNAYNPVYSLNGAGRICVNEDEKQFFKDELETEGFTVNQELADWYNANQSYWRDEPTAQFYNAKMNGATWEEVNTSAKTASGYNTAIYVISRVGNEGSELPPYQTDKGGTEGLTDGDYLKLTAKEQSMLTELNKAKQAGTFDRIILLINSANPILDDLVENETYGIDAALWIGLPGSHGIPAVADILSGVVTPSGRMSTAWYSDRKAVPNWNYFSTRITYFIRKGYTSDTSMRKRDTKIM